MSEEYLDYKYTLALLEKLNRFVESDSRLSKLFLYKGYNLWQAYQQSVFGDILGWSSHKQVGQIMPKGSAQSNIKTLILSSFIGLFSLGSAIFLIITRRKVLVFTLDKTNDNYKNDFRLNSLYKALETSKASYLEVIHTVIGKNTIKNLLYRLRPSIYLQSVDMLSYFEVELEKAKLRNILPSLDFSIFTKEEKALVESIIIKYGSSVVISRYRIFLFSIIFGLSSVKKIFSIDDVRTINELVVASELSGISFYSIQHGHFTKYHVGWLKMTNLPGKDISPKKTLVWSQYWKDELLRLGTYFTQDQIVVVGEPKSIHFSRKKSTGKKLSILLPYEKNAPKRELLKYIEELLKHEDVELIFKLRPDQEKLEQIEEYGLTHLLGRIKLSRDIDSESLSIDVVVGTYSTFLYDMVKHGYPVAILNTSIDYGEGMVKNGLADIVDGSESAYFDLCKISNISEGILIDRRNKLIHQNESSMEENLVKALHQI